MNRPLQGRLLFGRATSVAVLAVLKTRVEAGIVERGGLGRSTCSAKRGHYGKTFSGRVLLGGGVRRNTGGEGVLAPVAAFTTSKNRRSFPFSVTLGLFWCPRRDAPMKNELAFTLFSKHSPHCRFCTVSVSAVTSHLQRSNSTQPAAVLLRKEESCRKMR